MPPYLLCMLQMDGPVRLVKDVKESAGEEIVRANCATANSLQSLEPCNRALTFNQVSFFK